MNKKVLLPFVLFIVCAIIWLMYTLFGNNTLEAKELPVNVNYSYAIAKDLSNQQKADIAILLKDSYSSEPFNVYFYAENTKTKKILAVLQASLKDSVTNTQMSVEKKVVVCSYGAQKEVNTLEVFEKLVDMAFLHTRSQLEHAINNFYTMGLPLNPSFQKAQIDKTLKALHPMALLIEIDASQKDRLLTFTQLAYDYGASVPTYSKYWLNDYGTIDIVFEHIQDGMEQSIVVTTYEGDYEPLYEVKTDVVIPVRKNVKRQVRLTLPYDADALKTYNDIVFRIHKMGLKASSVTNENERTSEMYTKVTLTKIKQLLAVLDTMAIKQQFELEKNTLHKNNRLLFVFD